MTPFLVLPFAAAVLALVVAVCGLLPKKRSLARRCFVVGMVVLAAHSVAAGLTVRWNETLDVLRGLTAGLIINSFLPAPWLAFSLVYSRGDYRESLRRWKVPLGVFALLPVILSVAFHEQLVDVLASGSADEAPQLRLAPIAKLLNMVLLVANVCVLMNLEQTFRAAVGTMRWRIKFVVLGLGVIFGARVYVQSQALLFSAYDVRWSGIESSSLLIGCVLLVTAYIRTEFAEVDVYPSRAVLGSSVTVLMTGGYLFAVGVLANIVRRLGGAESFQFQALVVLLGIAGLGLLFFSDRLRQRVHSFVGRHFAKAQHDSVRIWTEFSRRLANVKDQGGLCAVAAKLVSDTFEALSVTVWLVDEEKEQLVAAASTTPESKDGAGEEPAAAASKAVADGLRARSMPFDLEAVDEPWVDEFRRLNQRTFPNGGNRWCVPLRAGEQSLGALVLADRVNGAPYTAEELQLLQCISDQVTSVLLNLRLGNEVARAREMEAFRTMSAFFVHDLKNTASSLNLMLKNLPVHFDDPEFREDALRGIGNTARRIDEMIGRLSALRQRPAIRPAEADLNQLVAEVLNGLGEMPHVTLTKDLQAVPVVLADREQIQSVITNLVLNARDAVGQTGRIHVRTEHAGGSVVLSVADNGCGMSEAFLKESLFRPFQSTKKKGLGIGMFQSRMIVEAHGGNIRVESETGKGSTFRVSLPVKDVG